MSRSIIARLAAAFGVVLLIAPASIVMAGAGGGDPAPPFDFDGDTKSDLLLNKVVAPNVGLMRVQILDGAALTTNGFPALLPAGFDVAGAGDFEGTGQADILARKTTAPNQGLIRIYDLDATGLVVSSNVFPALVPAGFSLIGIGDLDGNGKDDLAYVRTSAPNLGLVRVYLFSDSGDRTIKSTGFPAFLPTDFVGVGLADIDGDGLADIVARKTVAPNEGLVRVFLTAAGGLTVSSSTFPMLTPTGYEIAGVGTFDGDALNDFLLEKTSAPNVGLVRLQFVAAGGMGIASTAFPNILPASFEIVSTGDYDGVNQMDFGSRNTSTGLIRIFIMDAAGTGISMTGFPSAPSTDFEVVAIGPVLP